MTRADVESIRKRWIVVDIDHTVRSSVIIVLCLTVYNILTAVWSETVNKCHAQTKNRLYRVIIYYLLLALLLCQNIIHNILKIAYLQLLNIVYGELRRFWIIQGNSAYLQKWFWVELVQI